MLCACPSEAQTTAVSGQVTDAGGQSWNNGTVNAVFLPNPSYPSATYTWTGGAFNPRAQISSTLSGSGSYSISIPSNLAISPANTQWRLTFCSAANGSCYVSSLTISGATQTLNATPPAIQVQANAYNQPTAYSDSEIAGATVGFSYFNLSDQTLHVCTQPACTWVSVSGSGGSTPAPPGLSAQFANSGHSAPQSATCNGSAIGIDNGSSPTTFINPCNETVQGNVAIAGPRPYIDVTAPPYNADPTGAVDATTAIQAAITAACAISTSIGRPGVYLPPGKYTVSQPQTPSTSPVFTTCGDLYLYSNGSQGGTAQFRSAPQGAQISVRPGGSPNAAPVFEFKQQPNSTVENLGMGCYNECIWVYNSTGMHFKNDALAVASTGITDNSPLKITNSFWIWVEGGTLETNSGSIPTLLLTGETSLVGEAPLAGLLTVRDVVTAGGGFEYLQKVAATSGIGTWSFRNVTQEDSAMAFLTIAESSPGLIGGSNYPSNITFDTDQQSDTTGGTAGILMYESTQTQVWAKISVTNSTGPLVGTGTSNDEGKTVAFLSYGNPGTARSNANGPLGVQLTNTYDNHSFDLLSEAFDPTNSGSSAKDCSGLGSDCGQNGLAALRLFSNRTSYSTLGLDASQGVMFGLGNSQGYTAALQQGASGDLDVLTTRLPAPTNVTATATTGGSLANGNYYVTLWATTQTGGSILQDCFQSPTTLSSTMISSVFPVVVSGGNNAVNVTWTAPAAGPASPVNYCMQVVTSDPNPNATTDKRVTQGLEFSAPATSFLYTGQAQSVNGTSFLAQTILTPVHRFGYNCLAVNTLSCGGFNFNVNGTANIATSLTLNGSTAQTGVQGSDTKLLSAGTVSGTGATLCTDANGGATTTGCSGGGSGPTIQTNGTNNASQTTLNFVNPSSFNGLAFTFSNPTLGNETFSLSGTLNNAGLTNPSVTVNSQTCTLGGSCTLPFSVNGAGNTSQAGMNLINSATFNGLSLNFSNPGTNQVQPSFSGTLGNGGLTNSSITVNTQSCVLGGTCTIPFQTNTTPNTSQNGVNFLTSTTNSVGLTVTPSNPSGNQEKFEVTGLSYAGNAATATTLNGCTTNSTPGSICVWNGTAWVYLNGNSSGTAVLTESSVGVPSWGAGSSTTFQANGVGLTSSSTVNFENSAATNGITLQFSNPSAGNVQLGLSGTLNNAGLTNSATTVNGQTCTLGSTCTIPIQTNGAGNTSQAGINHIASTTNSCGTTITPSNPSGIQEKFEATGTTTISCGGTGQTTASAAFNALSPMTTLGDIIYGGSSGAGTRLAGCAIVASVPCVLTSTPTSGPTAAAPSWQLSGVPIDDTNPATLLATDRANYINWTSGTALALPAVTASFASNFPFAIQNTSTTLTITPNAGESDLIDGAANGTVIPNFAALVYQEGSTAPFNWRTIKFPTFAAFGSTCSNGLTWNTSSGFSCLSAAPIKSGDAAGGVLSGTYPNPTIASGANLGTPGTLVLTNATSLPAASVVAGALANGMTATTQSAGDNSTKLATTAYVDATKHPRSCEIVWGGTGAANVLQSGDDAIANQSCYNKTGVTETITAVYCRSDVASNTTTVNPTFGTSGTGTTILSGALTCGSSGAYSSTGTVTNASLTDGSNINPVMGGTLTGTSIHLVVMYTLP